MCGEMLMMVMGERKHSVQLNRKKEEETNINTVILQILKPI